MIRPVSAAVLAASLAACGGSVTGTVGGNSLDVLDAMFFKDPGADPIIILLSDTAFTCDDLKRPRIRSNSHLLQIDLARVGRNEQGDPELLPTTPGDYSVAPVNSAGGFARFAFSDFDSICARRLSKEAASAQSGLVKLTAFSSTGSADGTFEATFGGGDTLTGQFNAHLCDVVLTDKVRCY